ncbi:hypothetical protein ACFRR6_25595 [Streptomyces sp. NPDC056891]|uniref:hypothetical protein n=1 Tax=Streptomyces sp. NPDC056891 TaxID=3345961 RepID=UPI0036C23507
MGRDAFTTQWSALPTSTGSSLSPGAGSTKAHLGLVAETSISVRVRVHSGTQFFKLYVVNNEDAFFGYYPTRPNKVVAQGETIEIYDLVGKDTVLFHHSINDGESSGGAQQVQQARMWFDSVWETIGRDFDLDAR